jgi:hypothetical protein
MIALPMQPSYQLDKAEQPPNTAADQHGRVRRTTQAISVAARSQDADQLAHGLASVRKSPHTWEMRSQVETKERNRQRRSTPVQHLRAYAVGQGSDLGCRLRQLGDVQRDPPCLIAGETSPLGHRLGLASLMDGTVPPLPFQLPPLSSSRPKQLG